MFIVWQYPKGFVLILSTKITNENDQFMTQLKYLEKSYDPDRG